MRIGVDARELRGHATGVGRYLQRLLQEWAVAGTPHRFTLYSPDGRLGVPPGLDGEIAIVPGSGGTRWEQGALASAIRRDRPDVVFAPGYTAPLRTGRPLVVAIHDVSFAAHPEWFRWREGLRRRWLSRLAARRAHAVVTISEFSRAEIVRHLGISSDRIRVIPLGVGLEVTSERHHSREPLVLFVGSIFNRRHVPELVHAFGRLATTRPALRLEIVGENRTWPRQEISVLVAETGAADRIRLRDWVSDTELASLYARASTFAFFSDYEGFGLTPLEALASGVPPVVLDTPVAREVYEGAAVYASIDTLQEALASVVDDETIRRRVLDAAPGVLARYQWRETAARTLRVLEEAARS